MRAILPFVGLVVVTSGCVQARGVAIGPAVPSRPPSCLLGYAQMDPAEAMTRWRQVGSVCVSHGRGLTVAETYEPGDTRDALTDKACDLGAEMVSPVGTCANGRANGVEFGAYVVRRASP